MQWRKLFDFNPMYTVFSDKIAVRDYIEARVGDDCLVPCLWTGDDPAAIPFATLDPPYVLKSTHGSGHTFIVEDRETLREDSARQKARSWLDFSHGVEADEPGYCNVPHRLIAERLLLANDGSPPLEIKAFVFDGTVQFLVAIIVNPRDRSRLTTLFTRDWTQVSESSSGDVKVKDQLSRPDRLSDMVEIAERVAAGFEHLRVDMYLCEGRIYVGEVTVYSQSGLIAFDPDEEDVILGRHWRIDKPLQGAMKALLAGRRKMRVRSGRQLA